MRSDIPGIEEATADASGSPSSKRTEKKKQINAIFLTDLCF
jgi:hypothetical protein